MPVRPAMPATLVAMAATIVAMAANIVAMAIVAMAAKSFAVPPHTPPIVLQASDLVVAVAS